MTEALELNRLPTFGLPGGHETKKAGEAGVGDLRHQAGTSTDALDGCQHKLLVRAVHVGLEIEKGTKH